MVKHFTRKIRVRGSDNHKVDKTFLGLTLILTIIGLIAISDASAPLAIRTFGDKFFFVKQQLRGAGIGIIAFFIFSKIHYSFWKKIAVPLFFLSILALTMVFIPGIGARLQGARRWLNLGVFSFQPSELVKLAICIYIAKAHDSNKRILSYFFPIVLAAILIMLQPDLGTTLVLVGISFMQFFVSGIKISVLLASVVTTALAAFLLIIGSSYRRERLLSFLGQSKDEGGISYHVKQILLALGSGGALGVGLGQSRQKYLFLPETATDSIFAVIAEEIGFVGSSLLILLFAYFIYKGIDIAKHAPDSFSRVLVIGLISWIGVQTLINIGSIVALIPLTGVPLPFLSYGGTALAMTLGGMGIILNVSKYAKQ